MSVRLGKGSSSLIAGVLLLISWRSGQIYTRIGPTTLLCATTCRRDYQSLSRHITTCNCLEFLRQVCADLLYRLRRFRRAAMDSFSKSGVSLFQPIQHREATMLALDLMKSPSDRETHLRRHSLSIMLSINYHLPPAQSETDPLLLGITDLNRRISHGLEPGAHLVEFLPWLRYAPSMYENRTLLSSTL